MLRSFLHDFVMEAEVFPPLTSQSTRTEHFFNNFITFELLLLCRTPEKLYSWIKAMVDAYHLSQEGTLMREARDLMSPKTIKKMEELKKLVKDHFM